MLLEVSQRLSGGVAILDLVGRVTIGQDADSLRIHMMDAFKTSHYVLLNCEKVTFADSSGIGEMVAAYSSILREGGVVKLLNPHKRMRYLLEVTNLDKVFEILDDEGKAVASFNAANSAPGQQGMNEFLG